MRLLVSIFLLINVPEVISVPPPKYLVSKSLSGVELPPALTEEDFDSVTAEQLTLVEFFSPYCSHCKQLAPVWEQAYSISQEEQENLGISMRQVNCVESGDLCERESIYYYPNLRLYAPVEGDSGTVGKHIDTFPRGMTRTAGNFKKYLISSVAEFKSGYANILSASEELDVDLGLKLVAGEADEPYFVALFSSTNEQYKNGFPESCQDCVEHKQIWEKLSVLVMSESRTAHLNCHSHPVLCKQLGFPSLADPGKFLAPRYIMFVPKEVGRIRFDYPTEADINAASMKAFVSKLSRNCKYDEISPHDLLDLKVITPRLPENFQGIGYPLSNKMTLVFSYDKSTVTPEDKAIMPYLLEMATLLPFDIDLYTSSGKKFEEVIEKESKALVDYINQDETFAKRSFDRKMFLSTSLTLRPTLYIFKEHSLVPVVFQTFALEDIRMPHKIRKWVQKNMKPMFGELTPSNYKSYFIQSSVKSKDDRNDRVAITFVNSDKPKELEDILFSVSMVSHQYHYEKQEYYYQKLLKEREIKDADVAKLKEKNADSAIVIGRMRKLIQHLFYRDDVAFTYIDLARFPALADNLGLNIDGKEYVAGDTLVVSNALSVYWDQNLEGTQLRFTPQQFREILKYLLDTNLVSGQKPNKLSSKLVNSPFHRHLRFFDVIHQFGFFGYVFAFIITYILLQLGKIITKIRRGHSYNRRGDIGGGDIAKAD